MSNQTEINRIKTARDNIATAIRGKGVTVPTTAKVDDLASLVSAIPTGTDTSDATATASHILKDKTAYVKGEKVTGNIYTYDGSTCQTRYSRETDNGFVFNAAMGGDRFVKSGDVYAEVEKADFGDAESCHVAEGFTFTSENGVCIEGTVPCYQYEYIEAHPADETDTDHVFMGEVSENTLFADEIYLKVPKVYFGDVPAYLVHNGFTFTSSEGCCIEGTMPSYGGENVRGQVSYSDNDNVYIETPMEGKYVSDGVWTKIPLATFGDVSPDCVKAGECFTSDAGFWVEGTMPVYDYTPIEAFYEPTCDTDDDFAFLGYTVQSIVEDEVYLGVPKSSFGDVIADYVGEGYTFTSENGVCIEGTMPIYDYTPMPAWYSESTDTDFVFGGGLENPRPTVLEDELYIKVPKTEFGNAKASDVRKGKTFTSADGVCITGTYEAASVKTCTVNVTFSYNPRNYMISATTYANGAFSNSITRASTGASVSIPNVVCGSVLIFNGQNAFTPTWSASHTMGGDQNVCAATVPSNSGTYTLNIGVFDD